MNIKKSSMSGKIGLSISNKPEEGALMAILTTTSLESNKRININFNGGELSSDAGLLLIANSPARLACQPCEKDLQNQ